MEIPRFFFGFVVGATVAEMPKRWQMFAVKRVKLTFQTLLSLAGAD
jgi:hypothetical protein